MLSEGESVHVLDELWLGEYTRVFGEASCSASHANGDASAPLLLLLL